MAYQASSNIKGLPEWLSQSSRMFSCLQKLNCTEQYPAEAFKALGYIRPICTCTGI